jgi:threonine aldolase
MATIPGRRKRPMRSAELFETDCEVYFVFNGTAANSLALASLCQSYHSVICSDQAHVETDECGAPEFFSNGSKLLAAASADGKLTPNSIRELATKRQRHSLSQAARSDHYAVD